MYVDFQIKKKKTFHISKKTSESKIRNAYSQSQSVSTHTKEPKTETMRRRRVDYEGVDNGQILVKDHWQGRASFTSSNS
jgi:hypothetical protein